MKMSSLFAGTAAVALATVFSAPAFAQVATPFADVPMDHWAYQAVEKLRNKGIVIGYPDGTYGGKRPTTRYEFAIAISRLLDLIPAPQPAVDLTPYLTKSEADAKFATKEDVATLRRLVEEFRTELTTLGVDLNNVKRRVDALDQRVTAIENEMKRVKIGGEINVMARGNHRTSTTIDLGGGARRNSAAVIDQDGFRVTKLPGKGSIWADTRVLHDVDLNITARLSDVATAKAVINFGNYLPFLNSVASYSGARSDRSNGVGAGNVNQNQDQTVYFLTVDTPVKLFGSVTTNLTVGRLPLQLTPYTLKLIDVDQYFYNSKTDLGDIPVDGGKVNVNLGSLGLTGFAGKVNPVKFVSNINNEFPNVAQSGLYAGAAAAPNTNGNFNFAGGFRGNSVNTIDEGGNASRTGNRPTGSSVSPGRNGAMSVEQLAGVRAVLGTPNIGTLGATYMVLAGNSSGAPAPAFNDPAFNGPEFGNANSTQRAFADAAYFNRVFVYGADFNGSFAGIGINASYTKTDTGGERLVRSGGGLAIDTDTEDKIDDDNAAWDAGLSYAFGKFNLGVGYKEIQPYFAAPGYWGRIGSWTNPVDVKGLYGNIGYAFNRNLGIDVSAQFLEGTGNASDAGGLTEDDGITNVRGGLKYQLTSASNVDFGVEWTQYEVIDGVGANIGQRGKPEEWFWNIGYGYAFNPNASFKLLYQIIEYKDKGTGFDTFNGDGGVAAAQFRVKF